MVTRRQRRTKPKSEAKKPILVDAALWIDAAAWGIPHDPTRELIGTFSEYPAWRPSSPSLCIARYRNDPPLFLADATYAIPPEFFLLLHPEDEQAPRLALRFVVEHGEPVCRFISIQMPDDQTRPIRASDLRVRLQELTRQAVEYAGRTLREPGQGLSVVGPPVAVAQEGEPEVGEKFREALEGQRRIPRRGKRLTDTDLRRAAEIYERARASLKPPTLAVQKELHIERSTAGRWIAEARRRGLLAPYKPQAEGKGDAS